MSDKEIVKYYRSLLIEQDPSSPHYYFSCGAEVREKDVVLDIGAAEGIFALEIIEKAKKVYLIEGDLSWIEPLKETFRPWRDKVTIIPRYVSDVNTEEFLTLDRLFFGNEVNFIKMDIEGHEEKALRGADFLLSSNADLTIVACSYHTHQAENNLRRILYEKGFSVEISSGYMIFFDGEKLQPPYLRRGLVVGKKRR